MPAPGGRERWGFMLQPGEQPEQMGSPEQLAALLGRWIKPQDLHIERQAVYRFHARCCDSFQQGRVFLAGDAAHITRPLSVRGWSPGCVMRPTLCWKLAWVSQGRAAPGNTRQLRQRAPSPCPQDDQYGQANGSADHAAQPFKALLVHGLMRLLGLLPALRAYFEELKIKPANRFGHGLFLAGKPGGEATGPGGWCASH